MRKLVLIFCLILSARAFAEAAQELVCTGVDKLTNKAVEFQVEFTGSAPGVGFTNMQAIITKINNTNLSPNITFQMFEANQGNTCKVDGMKEIMYPDVLTFDSDDGVRLKASCGAGKTFDISATCKDLF